MESYSKKIKCPRCGKTAIRFIRNNELIVKCKARNPCSYIMIKKLK